MARMKVSRLRDGYRIHLSDSHFHAIRALVEFGLYHHAARGIEMDPHARAAIARRCKDGYFLRVDDDRRNEKETEKNG